MNKGCNTQLFTMMKAVLNDDRFRDVADDYCKYDNQSLKYINFQFMVNNEAAIRWLNIAKAV